MKATLAALRIAVGCSCLLGIACTPAVKQNGPYDGFIRDMAARHAFDDSALNELFQQVEIRQEILDRIKSPAETMPWYRYRKIFLTESRIREGVQFWRDHEKTLTQVERDYGVPPQIIVAILGVETRYGQKTGNHRIIDALSTLAFAYPPRSPFFTGELEQFLLLCREENMKPLAPTGSYAGAMGMPQFMPSSFRAYAADFDHDGKRDIWHNPADVIASIANYFRKHGWQPGQIVAVPAQSSENEYKSLINGSLKPSLRLSELESRRVEILGPIPADSKVKLLAFEQEHGEELWTVLNNFYVITRYNHSPLYALAVFQLSEAISKYRPTSPYE